MAPRHPTNRPYKEGTLEHLKTDRSYKIVEPKPGTATGVRSPIDHDR
jgi:hypothetical protein